MAAKHFNSNWPLILQFKVTSFFTLLQVLKEFSKFNEKFTEKFHKKEDFNVNHVVNEMFYGCLFKQCKLDALLVTSYCPGHSALNPVERLWSPCTQALKSSSIPANLPGELPPCQQRQLSADEHVAKEKTVFDNAMARINHYWENTKYADKRIAIPSGSDEGPFKDFGQVHAVVSTSATRLREDCAVCDEFKFVIIWITLH